MKKLNINTPISILIATLILAGAYLINTNLFYNKTITVSGEAKQTVANEVARFSVGYSTVSDNREEAINEVNTNIEEIVNKIKQFGISDENIQTQSMGIYQREQTTYENGQQLSVPGQWSVSNDVQIKNVDAEKAQELSDLLASTSATNVSGPYFDTKDEVKDNSDLINKAVENAKTKATQVASNNNLQIVGIAHITEGQVSSYQPLMARSEMMGLGAGGGGATVNPGSSTQQVSVTVVFKVK